MTEGLPDISIAEAKVSDAGELARFYQKEYDVTYLFGEHDVNYGSSEWVESVLGAKRDVVYVAKAADKIIGSTVAVVARWNNSAQLCRTVVPRDLRGRGVATALCEKVRDAAIARGIDVLWGSLRNEKMVSISKKDGLATVGYLDGVYLGGEHETHLMAVRLLDGGRMNRVSSPVQVIYELDGVRESLERLQIGTIPMGQYPENTVVNPGLIANVASKGVTGRYDAKNRSLIVTEYPLGSMLALRGIEDVIKNAYGGQADYLQMTVLADKVRVMKEARDCGYKMTAVLPGWFAQKERAGGCEVITRYDCVLLSKSGKSTADPKFEELIRDFERGFERFPSGAYLRALIGDQKDV